MTGTYLQVFKGEWELTVVPAGPDELRDLFPSAVVPVWASFSSLGDLVALSSLGLTLSS